MILKKIKKSTFPKKGVKVAFGIIFGIFAFLYGAFLIVPRTIDIGQYTPMINDIMKDYTKLELVLKNPKISTTFDMGFKISADEIALKYLDKSDFLKLENSSIKINLLTLIVKNLNLDKIYVQNAELNLVFDKNKKYTIEDYIILPKNEAKEENNEEPKNEELPINIKNINIVADNLNIMLDDKNVSKKFVLNMKDNNIHLFSLNGPVRIKTNGYLGYDKVHFIDFNVDVSTPLPEVTSDNNQQNEPISEFKLPNFNPLQDVDKFKLYTKADVNLKISDINDFKAKGHFKLSDMTLLVKDIQLPKSYVNLNFDGNKVSNDIKFYVAENEYMESKGVVNAGKKTTFDINAKTEKISLNNIKILLSSILDMFSIKNDLKTAVATGYLTCDFNIKNNGNTIKSSGKSEIKNGSFKYPAIGVNLTDITSLLDFGNNKLTIKETSANLNGAKFGVQGEILTNSNLNINVNSDSIKISDIIKLLTSFKVLNPNDIKDFNFKSGVIKIAIKLTGTLQNIVPDANIAVDNLSLVMKSLNAPIGISNINISAKPKGKDDFEGLIDVNNFSLNYPDLKLNIKAPNVKMPLDSKKISINKSNITSDGTTIVLDGDIKNYMTKPEFVINLDGKIAPNTVLNMVDKSSRSLVKYQGQMPVKTVISGDLNNIKIKGDLSSNPQNYISVIDIDSIKGANNTLNFDMDLKGETFSLSDISLNSTRGGKVASVKGKISSIYKKNPVIDGISVSVPQKLNMTISALDNTKLSVISNLNVSGTVENPAISGTLDLSNLYYPPFELKVNDAKLNFKKSVIGANATGISVANSDFSGNAEISTNMSKGILINELNFKSNNFDSDALMKLAEKMPASSTAPGNDAGDIQITKGKGEIGNLKSGNLAIKNVDFNYNLKNNLFSLKNLKASVYEGSVTGDITYHMAQLRTTVDVVVTGVNAGKFSSAFTGLIVPVSGTASGMAKLSLKGATEKQQMQTLAGSVKFNVKNGEIKDFIKLENLLRAGNVLSQNIIGFNLNSVVSTVSNKNTGSFDSLEGYVTFGSGIANIETFKTKGRQMSMSVKGKYNMLTNYADMKVLGRISSTVVNVMGPLGNYSVGKALDNVASKNDTVSNILNVVKSIAPANPLFQTVSKDEISQIPELSVAADNKMFMAIIQGLANKSSTVKTFRWIDAQ